MIKTTTTIRHERKLIAPGSKIELDGAEEERLVEQGDAEFVDAKSDDTLDSETELSPDAQAFAKMHAGDAIEFVGTIATLSELFAFSAVESTRKGGPRKTVQEAFAQRVRDLTDQPADS